MRAVLWVTVIALLIVLILWARGVRGAPERTRTEPIVHEEEHTAREQRLQLRYRQEHGRYRRMWLRYTNAHRRVKQLTRTLAHADSTAEAINLACVAYGSCETLWRRAGCESHLNPYAQNPSGASGLYQFLPSTWRSTPYSRFSVWSPYANALAAGWMNTHGRGGEWACR